MPGFPTRPTLYIEFDARPNLSGSIDRFAQQLILIKIEMVVIGYRNDVDLRRINFLGEQFRGNVSFPSFAFGRQRMAMQIYSHA